MLHGTNTPSFTPIEKTSSRVNNPVSSYSNYFTYLKMNFPEHICTLDTFFINNTLKLKSYPQAKTCAELTPQEWLNMLGQNTYRMSLSAIVTLIFIKNHTLDITEPILYQEYAEDSKICYDILMEDFGLYVEGGMGLPKYTKVSPTVQKYASSVKSIKSNTKSKKSGRTHKAFVSTAPRHVDSQGKPYIIKCCNPEDPGDMASSSSGNSRSRRLKRRSAALRMAEALENFESMKSTARLGGFGDGQDTQKEETLIQ